jgi:lipid A 3-O-deacylase
MKTLIATAVAALLSAPVSAHAAEVFLGYYAHDIDDRISISHSPESGQQVVGGVRSERLESLHAIGRPRAHLLAGVNTDGGINYAAAGLSWRFNLGSERFYLQPGIGAAIHSGKVDLPSSLEPGLTQAEIDRRLALRRNNLDLGSRVLFEPELSLGWRATDRLALELSWIHLSHAQLASRQNPGLGDLGVRAVWQF